MIAKVRSVKVVEETPGKTEERLHLRLGETQYIEPYTTRIIKVGIKEDENEVSMTCSDHRRMQKGFNIISKVQEGSIVCLPMINNTAERV